MEEIGMLIVNAKGVRAFARALKQVYGDETTVRLKILQTSDTHKVNSLALDNHTGSINLVKGWEE